MPREDEELAGENDNHLAKEELPTTMKKATIKKLQDQLINKVTLEDEGLTSEEEVMTEVDEMPISVTSVTSGDTVF